MNLIITNESHADNYHAVEITNGKQSVFVGRGASGQISVCNMNGSHKAWRGVGRVFWNFDDAVNAYKSSFMKESIKFAQERI